MKTLVIIETSIVDKPWVAEYLQQVPALIHTFGGRYLGQSTQVESVEAAEEGVPHFSAVLEFPCRDDFYAFYNSDAYQPFKKARMNGSQSKILLIPAN